jgi:hypothetical protein
MMVTSKSSGLFSRSHPCVSASVWRLSPGCPIDIRALTLSPCRSSNFNAASVFVPRSALVNVFENTRRAAFKSGEYPAEPGSVHRSGLIISEKLLLINPLSLNVTFSFSCASANGVHQLNHLRIDIQFVVVKHEPANVVGAVHLHDFVNNALGRAGADTA